MTKVAPMIDNDTFKIISIETEIAAADWESHPAWNYPWPAHPYYGEKSKLQFRHGHRAIYAFLALQTGLEHPDPNRWRMLEDAAYRRYKKARTL